MGASVLEPIGGARLVAYVSLVTSLVTLIFGLGVILVVCIFYNFTNYDTISQAMLDAPQIRLPYWSTMFVYIWGSVGRYMYFRPNIRHLFFIRDWLDARDPKKTPEFVVLKMRPSRVRRTRGGAGGASKIIPDSELGLIASKDGADKEIVVKVSKSTAFWWEIVSWCRVLVGLLMGYFSGTTVIILGGAYDNFHAKSAFVLGASYAVWETLNFAVRWYDSWIYVRSVDAAEQRECAWVTRVPAIRLAAHFLEFAMLVMALVCALAFKVDGFACSSLACKSQWEYAFSMIITFSIFFTVLDY